MMIRKILVLVLAFMPFVAQAEEAEYDCEANEKYIVKVLSEPQECFVDGDCAYFNYGYPWQPKACVKAIVSNEEEEKTISNLALVAEYNRNCIKGNDAELQKYKELEDKIKSTKCDTMRLYCFKNLCRNKNFSNHYFESE